jgi:hypothetical protein
MMLNNNKNNNSDNTSKSETLGRLLVYTFLDNTNSNESDYKFNHLF